MRIQHASGAVTCRSEVLHVQRCPRACKVSVVSRRAASSDCLVLSVRDSARGCLGRKLLPEAACGTGGFNAVLAAYQRNVMLISAEGVPEMHFDEDAPSAQLQGTSFAVVQAAEARPSLLLPLPCACAAPAGAPSLLKHTTLLCLRRKFPA